MITFFGLEQTNFIGTLVVSMSACRLGSLFGRFNVSFSRLGSLFGRFNVGFSRLGSLFGRFNVYISRLHHCVFQNWRIKKQAKKRPVRKFICYSNQVLTESTRFAKNSFTLSQNPGSISPIFSFIDLLMSSSWDDNLLKSISRLRILSIKSMSN